jgi:tetratricopeptide (TPR) repeat protein
MEGRRSRPAVRYNLAEVARSSRLASWSLLITVLSAAPSGAGEGSSPATGLPFEEVSRRAAEAWQANRNEEALRWYREGVELNPSWDEGWWYLGSIYYEADRYGEARDAFARVTELKPEASPAWALRSLSEYRLKDFDAALEHLLKWQSLGPAGSKEISSAAGLHLAMLLVRDGQFDLATRPLTWLARSQPETPELLTVCGLVILEMAVLPADIPESERELVLAVGRAVYAAFAGHNAEAKVRFQEALARYPAARGLRYAYGLVLYRTGSEEALPVLRKETELFPDDVRAHLQIAFALLSGGKPAEALPSAREAVRLAPRLFASHLALGRALVETDALDEGIAELERASELAPELLDTYRALARAYALAGRTEDAARARTKMIELDRKQQPQMHP